MSAFNTITLLTDFGWDDEFVGVMKSVIRDLAPQVTTVDLTHGIAPFDIRAGSLALARAAAYLPVGVVVAVVDPGVGTDRRPIAVEVAGGDGVFIGPDNGLLAPAVAMAGGAERAVVLSNPDYQFPAPGATFAGRDIFVPAAAHLCNGIALESLGEIIDPTGLMPGAIPLPRTEGDTLVCEVLWVDRFGNCQLNVSPEDLPAEWGERVALSFGTPDTGGGQLRVARRATSYGSLKSGEVGLVLDSTGMLSVALDRRSARAELGLDLHDQVVVSVASDGDQAATTPVQLSPR